MQCSWKVHSVSGPDRPQSLLHFQRRGPLPENLTACPDALKDNMFFGADDEALQRCISGFNALIEHAISGGLAKLSVNVNNQASTLPAIS